MLEHLKKKFSASEGDARASALFAAIRFCFNQEILPPEWVVQAFFDATNQWFGLEADSLDKAFGTSPWGPKRLAQRKNRRLLAIKVYNHVHQCEAQKKAVDWEGLAGELGRSKSLLQDLYYKVAPKLMGPFLVKGQIDKSSRKRTRKRGMTER